MCNVNTRTNKFYEIIIVLFILFLFFSYIVKYDILNAIIYCICYASSINKISNVTVNIIKAIIRYIIYNIQMHFCVKFKETNRMLFFCEREEAVTTYFRVYFNITRI